MKRARIGPPGWKLNTFHGREGFARWRVTDEGILVEGESGPRRTQWAQAADYAKRAIELYGPECRMLADIWEPWVLDARTLIATICCESAVDPGAERHEPHMNDTSFGLTQLLTGTAYQVGRRIGWPLRADTEGPHEEFCMPAKPVAIGGSEPLALWREWLIEPWNNLALAAALHALNDERLDQRSDPLLQYIAFNSGGNYESTANEFGLHYHPSAAEAFILFFNDASALL